MITSTKISLALKSQSGYEDGWLPELRNNPFTKGLGIPPSGMERFTLLDRPPAFSSEELGLSHDQRKYCVLRLFSVMVPTARQVELVGRINMIIRLGYGKRNPNEKAHKAAFLASAKALNEFDPKDEQMVRDVRAMFDNPDAAPTGSTVGFALLGDVGMGKTAVTRLALSAIPQSVRPETKYSLTQVVHIWIDAPASSGRKQLCLAVFFALDRVLGTQYHNKYTKSRRTVEYMMLQVIHLTTLHAVGLIVVDELQHVLTVKEGHKDLLNFLVTLQNVVGVPIIMIGTNEARPLMTSAARLARRAVGLGQQNWPRLSQGAEWDDWLGEIWPHQWTVTNTSMSPEISEAIYDECQGIMDIAIKLIVLSQMRAISRGELEEAEEVMTPELIRSVAADEFGCIKPMIVALRDGREEVLSQIPDLVPLQQHVDQVLSEALGMTGQDIQRLRELKRETSRIEHDGRNAPFAALIANFVQRGYEEKAVDAALAVALENVERDDLVGLLDAMRSTLPAEPAAAPKVRRASAKLGSRAKSEKPEAVTGGIVSNAGKGDNPVGALERAGIVKSFADVLAG